jgi:hypothetical protein
MPIERGRHLGGIRTLEDIRVRCYCDPDTRCWHWRLSSCDGSPRITLYIPERGGSRDVRGLRGAMIIKLGRMLGPKETVYRNLDICRSRDCVNPDHGLIGGRKTSARHQAKHGTYRASPKSIAVATARVSKITPEIAAQIRRDPRPAAVVAQEVGLAKSSVHAIRRGDTWRRHLPGYSVFTGLGAR